MFRNLVLLSSLLLASHLVSAQQKPNVIYIYADDLVLIEQGLTDPTAIVEGDWKYIRPHPGAALMKAVGIETGNSPGPQLYNLKDDIGEKKNLATQYPEKVKELDQLLETTIHK